MGGLGADHVADVQVDAAGNVFVVGEFSNSLTFDGTTLLSAGSVDGFVARLDALGALVWMVKVGGPGTDRAITLDVDANGNVAVAGEFTATANAFGTSITSSGGTVDAFVAKLDASSGTLQWVRQGGSDTWADRPYGITLAGNGNAIVAGEFKGTALFDGLPITSLIDPLTQLPGFDVFIASYDASGTLLWLQQGAASRVDRAIDVVSDAAGNSYVCGQYSDTVTFDVQHPGVVLNATFLVKFDVNGVEQWFRRCGGASFNHVRDMQLTSSGTLLLCGDLQGTMTFEDNVPNTIVGGADHAGYLLHVDATGELLGSQVLGSDNMLGAQGLVQQGGEVAVLGEFQCRLSSLSALYGSGTFLATGDPDLYIARYTFPGLQYIEAQQFGGVAGKQAGRIAALPGGDLVFCGSYADQLVFPSDGQAWGESPFTGVNGTSSFCGDPEYGSFSANFSIGLFDGFVARAYVEGRAPYDFFARPGGPCARPELDFCIKRWMYGPACPDPIMACDAVVLELTTPFAWSDAFMPSQPNEGPRLNILWSDGSNGPFMSVTGTGWYWCTLSSANNCWSVTDSVFVDISVAPDATVSDGQGVNFFADFPQPLFLCDTTVWLWCPTVQPGDVVTWALQGGGMSVQNDSILATVDGNYVVTVVGANGCLDETTIYVAVTPSDPLPNVTGVEFTFYDTWGGILDGDTLGGCPGSGIIGPAEVQYYIDSLPGTIPSNLQIAFNSLGLPGGAFLLPGDPYNWAVIADQGTGWYTFTFTVNIFDTPCPSDTLTFMQQDSIYWVEVPEPTATFPDSVLLCPGGTGAIVVQCPDCDQLLWQGPGIVSTSALGDTAWVDAYGYYQVSFVASVPWGSCPFTEIIVVAEPPVPQLFSLPPDGLVCPGDSAIIYTTTSGVLYNWEGPDGPIAENNDTIVVSELGNYYMQLTNAGGCVLGVGPITIAGFGSPVISVQGDGVLCPGDSIVLEVVATGATNIAWQPPLFGSSPTQVVYTPDLYLCWVTVCGTPYLLSMPIGLSDPVAEILDPGPAVICEGTPLILQGAPGAASYSWLPGNVQGQDLLVTQPGNYQLIIIDTYGCSDTTDQFFVGSASFSEVLTAEGDSACAGGMVTLLADGSGAITWYSDPFGSNAIGAGGH
jgi:hypothetical protein